MLEGENEFNRSIHRCRRQNIFYSVSQREGLGGKEAHCPVARWLKVRRLVVLWAVLVELDLHENGVLRTLNKKAWRGESNFKIIEKLWLDMSGQPLTSLGMLSRVRVTATTVRISLTTCVRAVLMLGLEARFVRPLAPLASSPRVRVMLPMASVSN